MFSETYWPEASLCISGKSLNLRGYFLTFAGALLINFIKHFQRILNPFKKIRIFAKISSNLFCQLTKEKLTTTLPQNQPFTLYSKPQPQNQDRNFYFFTSSFLISSHPFKNYFKKSTLLFNQNHNQKSQAQDDLHCTPNSHS